MHATPAKDPLLGTTIQDRYRIQRRIGQGGMGIVYEAEHVLIGRKVALKTLSEHAAFSAGCVARFQREAQAAAAVGNAHIVDVMDMGQLDNGAFYIVLEYLEGVELNLALAEQGRFPVARAVRIVRQLCEALAAVHRAGIIHRDLKPENVFLVRRDGHDDFVKVLDFGVCKFREEGSPRLTSTGDAVGTPHFMAPEQVEGRTNVSHSVDIYALGAILHFLLVGRPPFDAPTLPRLFLKICHDPVPTLAAQLEGAPPALDAVVQRALAKDPKERFDSCDELHQALEPFLDHHGDRAIQSVHETPGRSPGGSRATLSDEYTQTLVDDGPLPRPSDTETHITLPLAGLNPMSSRFARAALVTALVISAGALGAVYLFEEDASEAPSSKAATRTSAAVHGDTASLPPTVDAPADGAQARMRPQVSSSVRVEEPESLEPTAAAPPARLRGRDASALRAVSATPVSSVSPPASPDTSATADPRALRASGSNQRPPTPAAPPAAAAPDAKDGSKTASDREQDGPSKRTLKKVPL